MSASEDDDLISILEEAERSGNRSTPEKGQAPRPACTNKAVGPPNTQRRYSVGEGAPLFPTNHRKLEREAAERNERMEVAYPTDGVRPIGWYPDPAFDGQEQWFDGRVWTGQTRGERTEGRWLIWCGYVAAIVMPLLGIGAGILALAAYKDRRGWRVIWLSVGWAIAVFLYAWVQANEGVL
jgi:hypothetical protein